MTLKPQSGGGEGDAGRAGVDDHDLGRFIRGVTAVDVTDGLSERLTRPHQEGASGGALLVDSYEYTSCECCLAGALPHSKQIYAPPSLR